MHACAYKNRHVYIHKILCLLTTWGIKHMLPSLVHAVRPPPEPQTRPSEDALGKGTAWDWSLRPRE